MSAIRLSNAFLVSVIVLSHFFAPEGYLFYTHTMSEMAAQFAPNAWILTSGFVGAGLGYIVFSLYYFHRKKLPRWLSIMTFLNGVTLVLLAVFPTSYDGFSIPANEQIVLIHRYIAYVSNFITLATIATHIVLSKPSIRLYHLTFLVLAISFSAFFIFYNQDVRGLFQRLILMTTSVWTWLYYARFNRLSKTTTSSLDEVLT
jgi:hypothetical membrane protein